MIRLYLLCSLLVSHVHSGEDYYGILGVAKDADDRTIRKAFKKLAITKHPDKNPGDEKAHSEFVRINKAYEVLKDEELRKKYDQFGEEGLSENFQGGQRYQSWQFYNDNFGIYDEDNEIQTLSRADFQKEVTDSGEIWFINFYSTFCSHCHQLAPAWRKFAQEMDGVIRIGAVNCAEDPMLCQSQRVMGYPSLVLYPHGIFYHGVRDVELLTEFVSKYVKAEILHLTSNNFKALTEEWRAYASKPWVIDFCDDTERCLMTPNRRKLAAMLDGIVNVATVNCVYGEREEVCDSLGRTEGVVFYPAGNVDSQHEKELSTFDPHEISTAALSFMSGLEKITEEHLLDQMKSATSEMLVLFVRDEKQMNELLNMKRLPIILPDLQIHYADCSQLDNLCEEQFDPSKLPTAVLFKPGMGFDINYGGSSSHREVLSFVKESLQSLVVALSGSSHEEAMRSGEPWLIDYFAPWCPPCLRLLGELRRLHSVLPSDFLAGKQLRIGTLDCTKHNSVCASAGVSSYPNSILYNDGKSFRSVGFHSASAIVDFIDNSLNPAVIELTAETFADHVLSRAEDEIWIIDFFAPWCGPCQQLAPQFQRVARGFANEGENKLFFASVDCQAHGHFCGEQMVRSYPTIRAFRSSSQQPLDYPANMWRNADSISRWVYSLLPSLVHSLGNDFWNMVLESSDPWLVDFYAPWCGHCVQFAPYFEQIAKALDGRVKLAKIDCDQWPAVCQGSGIRAYPTIRFFAGSSTGARQDIYGLPIQSHHRDEIIAIIESQLAQRQIRDEL